jgi:hypothetical protein
MAKMCRYQGRKRKYKVAAQDQAFSTNNFKNKILKEGTDSKCWLYKQHEGTIDHVTSGCPIMAKST